VSASSYPDGTPDWPAQRLIGNRSISHGRLRRPGGQRGVLLMDLAVGHPGRDAVEDDAHGNPRPAVPRLPVQDRRIGVDEIEQVLGHTAMVPHDS